MRLRPWHVLIFIAALFLFTGWVSLPGETLDIGGFKEDHPVQEGLDLQGGLQVVLEADPPPGIEVDDDTLTGVRDTLERRVNQLGVSEPLIQTRGGDQIIVELPGVDDPEEAVSILQETALLEFIDPQGQFLPEGTLVRTSLGDPRDVTADGTPTAATPAAGAGATPGASPVASPAAETTPEATGPVYQTIISGADLDDAFLTTGATGVERVVGFRLKGDAADELFDFTSANIGLPIAIVLDKRVISAPVIQQPISNQGIITGVPPAEVDDLIVQLKAGALPLPLEVVSVERVDPAAGEATPGPAASPVGSTGG